MFTVTLNAISWPFSDILRPITDYILGPSTGSRPFLELTPILHPFINVGQCFGSGGDLPFTVTLNVKQTIISFVETYQTVGTAKSFADAIGRFLINDYNKHYLHNNVPQFIVCRIM